MTSEKRWTGYRGRPEVVERTVEEVIVERRSRSPRRKRRSSSSDERHEIEYETKGGYDKHHKIRRDGKLLAPSQALLKQQNGLHDNHMPLDYVSPTFDQPGSRRSVSRSGKSKENHDKYCDTYGRDIRKEIAGPQDHFRQTLPEDSYRFVMTENSSEPDKEFPDQPILQFWTWHTSLHLAPSDDQPLDCGSGVCRDDIADLVGDWRGSLVLDEQRIRDSKFSRHEFIAISEAKAFTQEKCGVRTYYIPKEREQSE